MTTVFGVVPATGAGTDRGPSRRQEKHVSRSGSEYSATGYCLVTSKVKHAS